MDSYCSSYKIKVQRKERKKERKKEKKGRKKENTKGQEKMKLKIKCMPQTTNIIQISDNLPVFNTLPNCQRRELKREPNACYAC